MGYLCSYVPEEIIHAAGFAPIRVRGWPSSLRRVDAHLQSYTCALCRSTLDQALSGDLGFLDGAVFAHTCDTMQALADLWRANSDESCYVDIVMQPTSLGSPSALPYLIAELERFRDRLGVFAGRSISDADLRASIALYDDTRSLVQCLQVQRGRMTARQFFAVLDAAQKTPREVFNPLLEDVLSSAKVVAAPLEGPKLYLVGAVLDEPRLLNLIDDHGAIVVGDDLCSGSRHFVDRVGTDGEPIRALAEYYLRRPPCPTKYVPTHDPAAALVDQMSLAGAEGVVFVLEKFCEPYAFDYAQVTLALDQAGVPHLILEMEHTPSMEALRTRLQAFLEIL
jgi:bcr-type benzoyl-CoA reductase subunit C